MWRRVTCGPAHILAAVLQVRSRILTADIMTVEELQKTDRRVRGRRADSQPTLAEQPPHLRWGAAQGPLCAPAPGPAEVGAGGPVIRAQQWFLQSQQRVRPRPFQTGQAEQTWRWSYVISLAQVDNQQGVFCKRAGHVTWAVAPGLILTSTQTRKKQKRLSYDFN